MINLNTAERVIDFALPTKKDKEEEHYDPSTRGAFIKSARIPGRRRGYYPGAHGGGRRKRSAFSLCTPHGYFRARGLSGSHNPPHRGCKRLFRGEVIGYPACAIKTSRMGVAYLSKRPRKIAPRPTRFALRRQTLQAR